MTWDDLPPGAILACGPESLPDTAIVRIKALADAFPEAEGKISGGLAAIPMESGPVSDRP